MNQGVIDVNRFNVRKVAVLSAGVLDPSESLGILDRLFDSALYRADQHSFLLYPARELPGYLARNAVPEAQATLETLREIANLEEELGPEVTT